MLNVKEINDKYDFEIVGASYIGAPKANTAMFVSAKVDYLVKNLEQAKNCLVFAETGIYVPENYCDQNCIVFTEHPQLDYARFLTKLIAIKKENEKSRKYILCDGGYYVGENVQIGNNVYIEPGCLIGHDVKIGDDVSIYSGTVVKNAVIGDRVIINEHASIGVAGFSLTEDEEGNQIRIPTLGKVIIGNDVEIGASNHVAQGNASDTYIDDYVKMDALVYIGHDVHLHKNVKVAAGVTIAGFTEVKEHAYLGVNASIRNRIVIGESSMVGMGAVVTRSIDKGVVVAGNPAKEL